MKPGAWHAGNLYGLLPTGPWAEEKRGQAPCPGLGPFPRHASDSRWSGQNHSHMTTKCGLACTHAIYNPAHSLPLFLFLFPSSLQASPIKAALLCHKTDTSAGCLAASLLVVNTPLMQVRNSEESSKHRTGRLAVGRPRGPGVKFTTSAQGIRKSRIIPHPFSVLPSFPSPSTSPLPFCFVFACDCKAERAGCVCVCAWGGGGCRGEWLLGFPVEVFAKIVGDAILVQCAAYPAVSLSEGAGWV